MDPQAKVQMRREQVQLGAAQREEVQLGAARREEVQLGAAQHEEVQFPRWDALRVNLQRTW
jgi:hypothetical protein